MSKSQIVKELFNQGVNARETTRKDELVDILLEHINDNEINTLYLEPLLSFVERDDRASREIFGSKSNNQLPSVIQPKIEDKINENEDSDIDEGNEHRNSDIDEDSDTEDGVIEGPPGVPDQEGPPRPVPIPILPIKRPVSLAR